VLIFDGDYPMAFGALDLNRDLTRPLQEVRNPSDPPKMAAWNDGETMASLPEMRRGAGQDRGADPPAQQPNLGL